MLASDKSEDVDIFPLAMSSREIFQSAGGNCYVDTADEIPKTIENCNLKEGTLVTINYGHGLPWATIASPDE